MTDKSIHIIGPAIAGLAAACGRNAIQAVCKEEGKPFRVETK
jgi:hypothetical protein